MTSTEHDPFDCALRMFGACGFCGARCSHDHSEECEREWERTYGTRGSEEADRA